MVIPIGDENPVRTTPWVLRALLTANILIYLFVQPLPWTEGPCALMQFFLEWAAIPVELLRGAPLSGPELATLPTGCALAAVPGKPVYLSALTSMFLHADPLHLGANMLFLWIFGNNIEDRLGHLRFLVFYLGCGLVSVAVFAAANPSSALTLVGASGAIAGVLGAYLIMFPTARVTVLVVPLFFLALQLPALIVLGLWFVLQLREVGGAAVGGGGVAYLAHVAGFVAGAGATLGLGFRPQRRRRRRPRPPAR